MSPLFGGKPLTRPNECCLYQHSAGLFFLPLFVVSNRFLFHWPTKKEQVDREYVTFSAQLDFALEMKIPVVIHSRKAETEAVDFLISRGAGRVLLHFFSGGVESAKKAADAGYFFTTPPVRSRAREKVLAEVPLDLILLESDSPYVAKTPAEAVKAAELVSSAKGISTEDAIKSTAQNARRFYGLRL